jgi:hypothetical protein
MKAVLDTNVLLVANGRHYDVSEDCVIGCIRLLELIMQEGIAVVDDNHRILGEYLKKTSPNQPSGAGDKFLKWLLQNSVTRMEMVPLTETAADCFIEFPDPALEPQFDQSDRKFAAVAYAHPDRPPIWQAVDCKWLNWWAALKAKGVNVVFLCPADICGFYGNKFPTASIPALPEPMQ